MIKHHCIYSKQITDSVPLKCTHKQVKRKWYEFFTYKGCKLEQGEACQYQVVSPRPASPPPQK